MSAFQDTTIGAKRKLHAIATSPSSQLRKRTRKRQRLIIKAPNVPITETPTKYAFVSNSITNTVSNVSSPSNSQAIIDHYHDDSSFAEWNKFNQHSQTVTPSTNYIDLNATNSTISPSPLINQHHYQHRQHRTQSLQHSIDKSDDRRCHQINPPQTPPSPLQPRQSPPPVARVDEDREHDVDVAQLDDVPMPILNEEETTTASTATHRNTQTANTSDLAMVPSSCFIATKCCQQLQDAQNCEYCDKCGDVLCQNSKCKDNLVCDLCGYHSADHYLCGLCDKSVVQKFRCIECNKSVVQCDSCFVECKYCFTNDIAKVCWDCQSDAVQLKCVQCQQQTQSDTNTELDTDPEQETAGSDADGNEEDSISQKCKQREVKFEHKSCIGIDWQSLFEKCSYPHCEQYICTQCCQQAVVVLGNVTQNVDKTQGVFFHCNQCESGNQYFCHEHQDLKLHQHVYEE